MTSVIGAPNWTAEQAAQVAAEWFGLQVAATALPSERDQNFRLVAGDGSRFVLKVANGAESPAMLDAENAAMRHLAARYPGLGPEPVAARTGTDVLVVDRHLVRVITFLDGVALGRVGFHGDHLLQDLGRAVAEVAGALATFDHPALHRRFRWDLALARETVEAGLPGVAETALHAHLSALLTAYRRDAEPVLGRLRTSVVHHDANDFNVLVDPLAACVTGIVDFGDMVVSHTVNDLAVACAYAVLDKADPLGTAAEVVRGWHRVLPLTDDELAALWSLIGMRLAMSVCIAAEQRAARPDNEYLGVSQGPIARTLPRLTAVHPRLAHYVLRAACGLPAVPHAPRVEQWLRDHHDEFVSPTGHDLRHGPVAPIDMSAGSLLVGSTHTENAAIPMWERVRRIMEAHGAPVGAGGYGEPRLLYGGEAFGGGPITEARRTIHVGLDLSLPAGSPLYAPIAGVVHGFENAEDKFDYGPVIVLRHTIPAAGDELPEQAFFTLWGHLADSSLDGLEVGQAVAAGERFARIGSAPTNGDWWPHTHMQIITDMLDVPVNMNGASRPEQWEAWQSICPDPNLILGIPAGGVPDPVPSTPALIERRRARAGGNLSVSYGADPVQMVRGRMQYLFDDRGRGYVDAYNNVAHVGHSHPRVVEAVSRQIATLNTNTRYLQRQFLDYADDLASTLPDGLDVVFLTASGSEANELALRLARAATGRRDVIVMDSAYHGHTTGLIDVSPYKHAGPGGLGAPDWVWTTPTPDVYRGPHRSAETAGADYAASVAGLLDRMAADDRPPGAYLAETCPSVGGQIILPVGYLAAVYQGVRSAGGVCIADEVQTGFGRLGHSFWGFEEQGVVPDIVVLGKPIANGYPMGAVVTSRAIADAFDNGMEFFSTFGGSTAACAAAHATLQVVRDEGWQAHAAAAGDHLLAGLRALADTHQLIGDVRGAGLFLGVDLVLDLATREPAARHADAVVRSMRAQGILAGTDGPFHNVLKLRGPLPLTTNDADLILTALDRSLTGLPS